MGKLKRVIDDDDAEVEMSQNKKIKIHCDLSPIMTRSQRSKKSRVCIEESETESKESDRNSDRNINSDKEINSDTEMSDDEMEIMDDLKKISMVAHDNLVEVRKEIVKTEPNIVKILESDILLQDKVYLVQLFEVYKSLMDEGASLELLDMRKKMNTLFEKYRQDFNHYNTFSEDTRKSIETQSNSLNVQNTHMIYKFKILSLNTSQNNKSIIYRKFCDMIDSEEDTDEYIKKKQWIDCALSLPHDNVKQICYNNINEFICKFRERLDIELYGMTKVKERLMLFLYSRIINPEIKCSLALVGPPGVGKCLGKNTPVLMFDGSIKMSQNIQVGDLLMGDNSTSRLVTSIVSGVEEMFQIEQECGLTYSVNKSHIMTLKLNKDTVIDTVINTVIPKNTVIDIPLMTYLTHPNKDNFYGVKTGIEFQGYDTSLSPFLYGIYISTKISLRERDEYMFIHPSSSILVQRIFARNNIRLVYVKSQQYKFSSDETHLLTKLESRCIAKEFKCNSRDIRAELLRGIITGNSTVTCSHIKIKTISSLLHADILYVIRTLGIRVKSHYHSGTYFITMSKKGFNENNLYSINVKSLGEGEYYGFTLEGGNSRFLLSDTTITHNTKISRLMADILDYPFQQISFGGITSPDYLSGHDYTYIGSKCGALAMAMCNMKYKNGILFMDEYDKIADNKDVTSLLLHVTDPSQNSEFRDKYLNEITIDLSNVWFIYSMNHIPYDTALSDRLFIVNLDGYTHKDKINIVRDYILPRALISMKRKIGDIVMSDTIISKMIERVSPISDKGVRTLERTVMDICQKISFIIDTEAMRMSFSIPEVTSYPVEITDAILTRLTPIEDGMAYSVRMMYI